MAHDARTAARGIQSPRFRDVGLLSAWANPDRITSRPSCRVGSVSTM
jgi:hypothetical protein